MKKNPIYVVGHKNPDTDAIVSAIAYAEYKKRKGVDAVAGRIGSVSSETEYLLERFGYEDPRRLYTAKSTLREIDMDKASTEGYRCYILCHNIFPFLILLVKLFTLQFLMPTRSHI